MERYILFDSGCLVCSGLAQEIEQAAGGWLSVRSLRSAEVQRHLDRAAPGWKWEPMLLELDGQQASVHRGIDMRLRIAAGVGARRAWAMAKLVQQAGQALTGSQDSRRTFLKGSAGVMAGVILGLPALPAFGREMVEDRPVPLGPASLVGGARARQLAAHALASRDMANLLKDHPAASEDAVVYEYATGGAASDWSATFRAVDGGDLSYLARPGGTIRTQANYRRDDVLVALSIDGMLARTTNLRVGQSGGGGAQTLAESCTGPGCSFGMVEECKRCCSTCSSYRSVVSNCCICTAPGGSYVGFCRPFEWGPCGIC